MTPTDVKLSKMIEEEVRKNQVLQFATSHTCFALGLTNDRFKRFVVYFFKTHIVVIRNGQDL